MKRVLLLLGIFVCCTAHTQTWSTVGLGTDYRVRSFNSSGIHLYVGGDFTQINGISAQSIARFDGANWYNLGSGIWGAVEEICFYNNDLFACGMLGTAGGTSVNNVAKWDGSNWAAVDGGVGGASDFALAACVYNNNMYVGGKFSGAGTTVSASRIAEWNGANWGVVGANSGISMGNTDQVACLAVYNGELYAGGNFSSAGGAAANDIAKWNDTIWSALPSGGPTAIWALAVYNNELYVGHGSISRVSKWNGTSWSSVGGGMNDYVYALAVYNGELYAGGDFTTADGNPANHIAKWNGTNWSALGAGTDTTVLAMYAYNGDLYVGGEFTTAGGITVNHIAKWNNPMGIQEAKTFDQVTIFPNPASDKFYISSAALIAVQIIDQLGRVILNTTKKEVDVSDMQEGVYFVSVKTEQGTAKRKVVIRH